MKLFLGLTLGFTGILYALVILTGLAVSFIAWNWQPIHVVYDQMFDWTVLRITVILSAICAACFWLDFRYS